MQVVVPVPIVEGQGPQGGGKTGRAISSPKSRQLVSAGLLSQMVSMFRQISCHF